MAVSANEPGVLYDPQTGLRYSLRVSARAKYARLSVSAEDGLAIVIPKRFARSRVPELIEERREWIRLAEERVADDREFVERLRATTRRPSEIYLEAARSKWTVQYVASASDRVVSRELPDNVLVISGAIDNDRAVSDSLQRFLSRLTRIVIEPWLYELADERAIQVGPVTVRGQRTRWASCSASGSVSLNRNLLFLRAELVRFVLLHELCHRLEMTHSPRFWRILTTAEPRTSTFNEELKGAWRLVPYWAQA